MKITGYYKNIISKVPQKAVNILKERKAQNPEKEVFTIEIIDNKYLLIY